MVKSTKEEIEDVYDRFRSLHHNKYEIAVLMDAYEEAIEAVNMLYDYSKRDMTVSELEKIKEILNKAPEDL